MHPFICSQRLQSNPDPRAPNGTTLKLSLGASFIFTDSCGTIFLDRPDLYNHLSLSPSPENDLLIFLHYVCRLSYHRLDSDLCRPFDHLVCRHGSVLSDAIKSRSHDDELPTKGYMEQNNNNELTSTAAADANTAVCCSQGLL